MPHAPSPAPTVPTDWRPARSAPHGSAAPEASRCPVALPATSKRPSQPTDRTLVTVTDDHPWAQAFVVIEARPLRPDASSAQGDA